MGDFAVPQQALLETLFCCTVPQNLDTVPNGRQVQNFYWPTKAIPGKEYPRYVKYELKLAFTLLHSSIYMCSSITGNSESS